MANNTIYPYGTGGQLPSGITIADDLNTNRGDVALSAKQGKILGDIALPLDSVAPKGYSSPPGRQDVDLSGVSFYNKTPGAGTATIRALSNTIAVPSSATGLHLTVSSGYYAIIYYLRQDGTWDSGVDSSGSFSEECYCAKPTTYNSGGVWLYLRKGDGSANITTTEAKNCITQLYWDVPDEYYLPIASEEMAQKTISVLFVGNSLTQDAVSYVPWLIRNLYPNLSFKFYMWYNGGYTLGQQYTKFSNNQACEIFSVCENTNAWTNYNNSMTMAQILSEYTFDIVCFQEYFNYKSTFVEADLVDFNNCLSYIRSNYGKNFRVATLLHAPKRSSATSIFNLTKSGNQLILQKTDADMLIAPGVAVYRALSTDLDNLGDQGHLSPDGTHTQEGLPCLLQAFVVFKWIMGELSIPISIVNCQLRMTTSIYNTLNIPGPNLGTGVIQGTDAQNALAQDVAVQAEAEGRGIEMDALINMN